MRDHKDITNWDTIPTLEIPSNGLRPLTAEECESEARRNDELLAICVDPATRRHLDREIKGWRQLAAARAPKEDR